MSTFAFGPPSDQLLIWGLNVLLQVTFLTAIGLGIAALVRRSPAVRHGVLCCSLALVLLSPAIALTMQLSGRSLLSVSLMREPMASEANAAVSRLEVEAQPLQVSSLHSPLEREDDAPNRPRDFAANADRSAQAQSSATSIGSILRVTSSLLLAVWLIGTVFLLGRLGVGWRRLAAILRTAKPDSSDSRNECFAQVGRALGLGRTAQLVLSDRVSAPLAVGLFRPRVVLPQRMVDQLAPPQLRDILIHEVAHILRRDQVVLLLQNIAGAIFWLHPLTKALNRQLAQAREEVCDNYVLAARDAPSYSRTLLMLAQLIQPARPLPGAVGLFTSRWRLERRVAGLLDERRCRMTALTTGTKTLVAALLLVMTAIAAMGTIKLAAAPTDRSAQVDDRSNGNLASNVKADEPAKNDARDADKVKRIEGRVVDHQGNKIAGADVWLPIRFRDPRHVAHGRTNQQGRFVLEAPKAWLPLTPNQGLSIAWAYKKGYSIATDSAYQALYSGMSNHPLELKLGPATDTSFVVLDPGGKPLAGASVEPHHFRSSVGYSLVPEEMLPMLRARSDMNGRARLSGMPRKGLLHVNVVSKQFGTQQQRLHDKADSPAERTIRLRPVAKAVGQLHSKDPVWARGVQFYLTTNVRGADPGRGGPTTGVAMVTSDANGRFEVGALAEGSLRIEGGVAQTAPVRAVLPREHVISAAKDNKLEIRLVSGVKVRGLVRTKDTHEPIANVVVSIRYGVYRQGDHVVSDKKGRFATRVLPGEVYQHVIAIPPGREVTQVGAPWNERFLVPTDVEEFEFPVIELARTIKVEGRLLDQHRRPVVEVNVHGVKGNRRYGFSKTDRQGRFVLRLPKGLEIESYSIWLDNKPYRAKVLKRQPLLLRVDLPKRKGADKSDRQSD